MPERSTKYDEVGPRNSRACDRPTPTQVSRDFGGNRGAKELTGSIHSPFRGTEQEETHLKSGMCMKDFDKADNWCRISDKTT